MTKKLGIYARQSREKETNGSIEDQIMQGEVTARDLKISYETYVDRGESAVYDNFDNRPEFKRLLEDVKKGVITAVFVYDLTRLTRNEETNLLIKRAFVKHKIIIYTVLDGIVDYEDSNSVLMNDIKNIFAARQVADLSLKIKSVLRKNVAQGRAHGGVIKPYGYTSDKDKMLIIDEEEALIINEIYNMALTGYGSAGIAKILNKRGIETKTFKLYKNWVSLNQHNPEELKKHSFANTTWAGKTVLGILQNTLYKGIRIHKGEQFPAPQIVDTGLWDIVQEKIKERTNKPGLSKHNYLLNDLCYCARCNSRFCGRTRPNKRDHIYYCASRKKKIGNCGIRGINITTIDSVIWTLVSSSDIIINKAKEEVEKIRKPDYIVQLNQKKFELEKKIQTENDNKLKIFSMYKKALLSDYEAENEMALSKQIIDSYNNSLSEINFKLEDNTTLIQKIDDATEFIRSWDELVFTDNFKLQYDIIRMFIEKIIIDFNEESEIYTINIKAKLPTSNQFYTFSLDTKGTLADNKNPNFQNRDINKIEKMRDNINSERRLSSLSISQNNQFNIMPPKVIPPHR